ncbi:MAG: NADH-quinone oxidoreductase subunit K [Halomonas sp.]|uniref:NADH-quinone oxidoreductase subunit K n=1 Tax=Halomonas sp. TaxID=1486246 RepID=UPI002ACD95D3|nr:NADH-quinone oxidoreductase subunit K [Halomonas sp.]MDZ7852580.1 NADH-quinone oxidoreductase subunit K [Halomonas sp.]
MTLVTTIGLLLMGVGLWAMLTRRNLFKIIIGFSIVDTGIHLVIVSVGYIRGGTAPILDDARRNVNRGRRSVVDPLPVGAWCSPPS